MLSLMLQESHSFVLLASAGPLAWASLMCQMVESACNVGDVSSLPGLGRSPGEGNGYPLQYSGLSILWTEEPGGLQSTVGQD